jgi:hypothetical protein
MGDAGGVMVRRLVVDVAAVVLGSTGRARDPERERLARRQTLLLHAAKPSICCPSTSRAGPYRSRAPQRTRVLRVSGVSWP